MQKSSSSGIKRRRATLLSMNVLSTVECPISYYDGDCLIFLHNFINTKNCARNIRYFAQITQSTLIQYPTPNELFGISYAISEISTYCACTVGRIQYCKLSRIPYVIFAIFLGVHRK